MIGAYPLIGVQFLLNRNVVEYNADQEDILKNLKIHENAVTVKVEYLRKFIKCLLVEILNSDEKSRNLGKISNITSDGYLLTKRLVLFTLSICIKFEDVLWTVKKFEALEIPAEEVIKAFDRICMQILKDIIGGPPITNYRTKIYEPIKKAVEANFELVLQL